MYTNKLSFWFWFDTNQNYTMLTVSYTAQKSLQNAEKMTTEFDEILFQQSTFITSHILCLYSEYGKIVHNVKSMFLLGSPNTSYRCRFPTPPTFQPFVSTYRSLHSMPEDSRRGSAGVPIHFFAFLPFSNGLCLRASATKRHASADCLISPIRNVYTNLIFQGFEWELCERNLCVFFLFFHG